MRGATKLLHWGEHRRKKSLHSPGHLALSRGEIARKPQFSQAMFVNSKQVQRPQPHGYRAASQFPRGRQARPRTLFKMLAQRRLILARKARQAAADGLGFIHDGRVLW